MFFGAFALIALTVVMLFLTSAIYDSANKASVDTFFFQRNLRSAERFGVPETDIKIGETAMREILIRKYVTEYFYVIPDAENIAQRTRADAPLSRISDTDVFIKWTNTTAEDIKRMANQKMMRTVQIDGEITKYGNSNYWVVPYVLYTWTLPNDMNAKPVMTRGKLLMDVFYEPGLREVDVNSGNFLKKYYNETDIMYDPVQIFKFGVLHLENITND